MSRTHRAEGGGGAQDVNVFLRDLGMDRAQSAHEPAFVGEEPQEIGASQAMQKKAMARKPRGMRLQGQKAARGAVEHSMAAAKMYGFVWR
jgi:hypothetical protein